MEILLISASQITRITGMSHWHLLLFCFQDSLGNFTGAGHKLTILLLPSE
jgi:hypothetical protein